MKSLTFEIGPNRARLRAYLQEPLSQEKLPAVIICPGGSYFMTSEREADPVAVKFLEQGFHAFILDYSTTALALKHKGVDYDYIDLVKTLLGDGDAISAFPQPLIDLALTLDQIHDIADIHGIDTDNLVTIGFSAGANLVALFGSHAHSDWFHERSEVAKNRLKLRAQIVSYGYVDLKSMQREAHDIQDELTIKAFAKASVNTYSPSEEDYTMTSAIAHLGEHVPPTFIWHTTEDNVVPVQQALLYASELQKHAIPWELHIYEKGKHGLSVASEQLKDAEEHVATWVFLAIDWLKRYHLK